MLIIIIRWIYLLKKVWKKCWDVFARYIPNLECNFQLNWMTWIILLRFQTFCKCVKQILRMYKYSLLSIEWQNIKLLSSFPTVIAPLKNKLTFLKKFCAIQSSKNEANFSSGVKLLNYLYKNLCEVYSSDLSCMLFYMFESCCNAYFKWANLLVRWIGDLLNYF